MPETRLNHNELEVMRILWDKSPLKPVEVQAEFGWAIENATLRSVLRGLMEKGHVKRRRKGKAFYYRSVSSRRRILSTMTRRLADAFCGGSRADLLLHLVEKERLTGEEIEELRRVAERRTAPRANDSKDREKP